MVVVHCLLLLPSLRGIMSTHTCGPSRSGGRCLLLLLMLPLLCGLLLHLPLLVLLV